MAWMACPRRHAAAICCGDLPQHILGCARSCAKQLILFQRAGGFEIRIDTQGAPDCPEVWALYLESHRRGQRTAAVCLPAFREPGHHWSQVRGGRPRQAETVGSACLVALGARARRPAGWRAQPDFNHGELVLVLPDLQERDPPDHRWRRGRTLTRRTQRLQLRFEFGNPLIALGKRRRHVARFEAPRDVLRTVGIPGMHLEDDDL